MKEKEEESRFVQVLWRLFMVLRARPTVSDDALFELWEGCGGGTKDPTETDVADMGGTAAGLTPAHPTGGKEGSDGDLSSPPLPDAPMCPRPPPAASSPGLFLNAREMEPSRGVPWVQREALAPHYGPAAWALLRRGLDEFLEMCGADLDVDAHDLRLHGPTIEGVGDYPATLPSLRVPGAPVHVVGDASGKFRGIVAAMVSGYYAGNAVAAELASAPRP